MTRKANKTKTQSAGTPKRAAIYVRVSSERQADADRVSSQAQEADSRTYCEAHGYAVVDIYRDTEKYRVGGRMVEPSGTRSDRPQLKRMIADAHAGRFEVIVAWREDRLYRSYRPMLDVLECLEQTGMEIELVKETFDSKIAPVKAWAARMELDAKHDRMMMGVGGRLAKGKVWNNPPPYGYLRVDGAYEVNPEEAQWVTAIWGWYAEGVGIRQIRKQLIEAGAKQRNSVKRPWQISSAISRILHDEKYHTGIYKVTWGGEAYEIPMPPIVDPETARRVEERQARYKAYPSGNMKARVLAAGLIFCAACATRMAAMSKLYRRANGEEVRVPQYACAMHAQAVSYPDCARSGSAAKLDAQIWEKVWELLTSDKFERLIEARIAALQAQEIDASAEVEKLEGRLDDLLLKRQQVLSWALEKRITESDMELRLAGMTLEQADLERHLNDTRLLVGNQAEKLIEAARLYREQASAGLEGLNDAPLNEEDARRQFELRRGWVQTLVTRVEVAADKTVKVDTEFDLLEVAQRAGLVRISDPSVSYRVTDLYRVALTL